MKNKALIWIGLTLGTLGLIAVVMIALSNDGGERGLSTAQAEVRDIEVLVTATGQLQPRDFVDVGAQVSGQLERLHVEVGDEVSSGDLLAEIDATLLEAQVQSTRAQLRNQQAILREREAALQLARLNYARQERLQVDSATAEELVESARASLQQAEAQVDSIQAQIEQTDSSLGAAEANFNYTRIYAPMDGTVVSVEVRRGQTLNATQTTPTILTIADLSTMTVQAQVSEADINRLERGTPVYFTTMGNREQRWQSQLRLIEPTPQVENNVVLYNALFEVPNPDGRLMTQMTTQVFFVVKSANDVVTVPSSAIQRDAQGAFVLTPVAGGTERVPVEVGLSDRVHTEIRAGLDAGDRVVLPQAGGLSGGRPGGAR